MRTIPHSEFGIKVFDPQTHNIKQFPAKPITTKQMYLYIIIISELGIYRFEDLWGFLASQPTFLVSSRPVGNWLKKERTWNTSPEFDLWFIHTNTSTCREHMCTHKGKEKVKIKGKNSLTLINVKYCKHDYSCTDHIGSYDFTALRQTTKNAWEKNFPD